MVLCDEIVEIIDLWCRIEIEWFWMTLVKKIIKNKCGVEFQNNMSMDGKEDYSDLPPNQKKKKLQAKVLELSKQVRIYPTSDVID